MSVSRDEMARRLGIDPSIESATRRRFVKLLGASAALAGLDGCTRMPASNILPYVDQPELTPGVPQYYATSMVLDGFATGLLVESHEGRPTKVEGNPDHPASLGAAGVYEQASVLQLYDPHRAWQVRHEKSAASWSELAAALAPASLRSRVGARGERLALLLEPTSSPLERELIDRVRGLYPAAHVHFYAPLGLLADAFVPQYDLREADVIVAIDADFLASGPFHLRRARQFAERRRPESARGMSRCYAIEASVTPTGMAADHRFAMRPGELVPVLERLSGALGGATSGTSQSASGDAWIASIARDLRAHAGRSVVIAGPYLPYRAQALAVQINQTLKNVGRTIWFTRSPLLGAGDPRASLGPLVDALRAGQIDTLICAGGNPAYASAAGHDLGGLLRRVRQSVYLGLYENETARECTWMVPASHYLEHWGDARAYDGTLSLVQPLIEPLHGGKTTSELLSLVLGAPDARTYDLVRESWRRGGGIGTGAEFDDGWRHVLGRGVVDGSAFAPESSPPPAAAAATPAIDSGTMDIAFRPHARVHDGTFANNAWLQELPDPITTLTWENAAQISPTTARRLGIVDGDILALQAAGRSVRLPAVAIAGHPDDAVTVHFGYGRDGAERVARGLGVSVYPVWPGDRFSTRANVSRVADAPRRDLAMTQTHRTLESSAPARLVTQQEYAQLPPSPRRRMLTLYEPAVSLPDPPAPTQWGMTIDLGACIGCGACTVACQAENNVPVVGREDVRRGREMHWLRIDWYAPADGQPSSLSQPMLCQHCEKAPCEYVCPVEATVHSRDGLNEMIYNRCVGTRFCSNNCPYKVRRFNWFDYSEKLTDGEQLVQNPDVTVRERGVMEKCTFCVQRIRQAEIAARVAGRPLRSTDVETACQQACPTRAIVFGSIAEPGSEVARERASPRAYAVLEDLGTEPRVLYLARVRNPNPDIERRS